MKGSGRIESRTLAGAAASGASEGSKPTVSLNPAFPATAPGTPRRPRRCRPRREDRAAAERSPRPPSRRSPRRTGPPRRWRTQPAGTRRSGTRRWERTQRRGGRKTRTRGAGGRASREPCATRTTSSRGPTDAKRASTNTRASVDPHTGHGRRPSSNSIIGGPPAGAAAPQRAPLASRVHVRAVT